MTASDESTTGDEIVVDSRGTLCPQPIIDLARAFGSATGSSPVVVLLADDPASVHDVAAWCRLRDCEATSTTMDDGSHRFVVRRTKA